MNILFTYDYGEENFEKIRKLGYNVDFIKENELTDCEEVQNADILVCYNPFDRIDIATMKNLKLIMLSSMGTDQLPIEKIKKLDISVTNNKGGYAKPLAEFVVLDILNCYKLSKSFYKRQIQKEWKINTDVLELIGKKVLFLGTGSIASEAAKRLQGFEMNIVGMNTNGRDIKYFNRCIPFSDMKNELKTADVVVSTLPYTPEMYHFMNYDFFDTMKDDSIFINISRGKLVDESALIKHLQRDKFLGVALDVVESEPLTSESPLWDFEKVYITSHSSWVSEMRNIRRFKYIYDNLKQYIANGELLTKLNIK